MRITGLINREGPNTSPVAVEYSLTPFGTTALGFLDELRKWPEKSTQRAAPNTWQKYHAPPRE
ncbi:MAG: winged helix-turn-helix transcriptional regulator [Gammaproteobacteria bacterium]|nr:winged helix-turn-helix transcriptional regulator [Gammaproteobacteria bacterium]